MGKAVARKSHRTVAEECWKSPNISKHVMHRLGTMLRQELKMRCSDSTQSVLRTQSLSDNPTFSWSIPYAACYTTSLVITVWENRQYISMPTTASDRIRTILLYRYI